MYQSKKDGDRNLIGIVPVGTGTICISDPTFVLDAISLPIHLQRVTNAANEGEYGTSYEKKVLVNTTMDGGFPVYAEYDSEGDYEPSRFIIELIEDSK